MDRRSVIKNGWPDRQKQEDGLTGSNTKEQKDKHSDIQTDKQSNRRTYGQTDKETDI
jgi:hypothetical protein